MQGSAVYDEEEYDEDGGLGMFDLCKRISSVIYLLAQTVS